MSNDLEVKKDNLPAEMAEGMLADAETAAGFDNIGVDDVAIPFIAILQSGSPQVKRGDQQVEGAVEGDFYNTVTGKLYKEIGLIPCAYKKAYVEWVPRDAGGGFVKEHSSDSDVLSTATKDDRGRDVLPSGNHIVTTAYHFCILTLEDGSYERVVLSFSSTQLKKSRKWNSAMMALMIEIKGKKIRPPMFSHIYKAVTIPETNKDGSWSGWQIGSPRIITDSDLYQSAKAFSDDVVKGAVKVAPPTADGSGNASAAPPEEGDDNVM